MASAMRVDSDDETEDQFEISLDEYLSDPVQSVEPPQTTSRAVAGEERGSAGSLERMEEGLTPGGYRCRTRSRTGSLRCGGPRPSDSQPGRRRTDAISESEVADGERTARSAARSRGRSTAIVSTHGIACPDRGDVTALNIMMWTNSHIT